MASQRVSWLLRALGASFVSSHVLCEDHSEKKGRSGEPQERNVTSHQSKKTTASGVTMNQTSTWPLIAATQSKVLLDFDPNHQFDNGQHTSTVEQSVTSDAAEEEEDTFDSTDDSNDDSYPNFSRHGSNALLPKYLTRELYMELKDKETESGVRLEDIIRAGVCLPHGAQPPRGISGVFAGDAESYHTYSKLFLPLLEEFHHTPKYRKRKKNPPKPRSPTPTQTRALQRFQSNLNPQYLLTHQLDPEGSYILYTRMRLARSIEGFRFGPCITRSERRAVERLLKACVEEWNRNKHNKLTGGKYISLLEMTNVQHDDLIRRRLLFRNPTEFDISAGLGRDWPDGRGIFCDDWEDTHIMIWANAPEDHLWIISNSKGGDVQGVFTKLSQAVWALETSLKHQGYSFVEDKILGFLNSCPSNIGPALKASVYVKLPRLSRQPGFYKLIRILRLEANSSYEQSDKRFTGIFDIANAESLGRSEVELINIMIRGVGALIELEKKLENGEQVDLQVVIDQLAHKD